MKKLFTLLAVIGATMTMNAATAVWSASDLDLANNAALDGVSAQINSNLSISFANGEATDNNYIRVRSVSAMPQPAVAFYSKNVITISATDAVITGVKFNILIDDNAGSDSTPGWKFSVNGTSLSGDDNTWTGSAETLTLTGGSKSTIVGMTIEYTPSTPAEPGTENTLSWMATQLSELSNNDVLDGMSFDINPALSFSLANNDSDKDIIYKKTSSAPTTINIYSKGSITFTAQEGASIKSIKFIVNTSEGTSNTPGWTLQDDAKNSYSTDNDTWTGNATEVTFTDKSAIQLMGFDITYTSAGTGSGDDNGDDDDDEGEYQSASLFFNGDLVGQGEIAQNVTLSDNGTTVVFTSNSANAQIDDITFNFGSAEEYTAIQYRYRPGGKSSNGVNSTNKGVFTFPCSGTLYLYVFNNQSDERNIQIVQNNETIYDHTYNSEDCDIIPGEGEASDIKIYPVYNVEVAKGTAFLLWPTNQVMISGFEFVPNKLADDSSVEEIVIESSLETPAYDLFGRQVGEDYRGIYIKNGKKYVRH